MSLKNALLALSLVIVGGFSVNAEAGGGRRVCQPTGYQPRPVYVVPVAYTWRATGQTYDCRTGITWVHYIGIPTVAPYANYDYNYRPGYNNAANTARNDAPAAPSRDLYDRYDRRGSQTDILQSAPRRQSVNDPDSDLDYYAFPRR